MPDYTQYIEDIVHEPTQTEGRGFDLTVAEVYEVTDPGRIDFGGGELDAATIEPHDSTRRHPDDDYEWWDLSAGQYLLAYNESLAAEDVALTIQPRDEVVARGASHPTLSRTALSQVPLAVGGAGLKLKENARVSTIVTVEEV